MFNKPLVNNPKQMSRGGFGSTKASKSGINI